MFGIVDDEDLSASPFLFQLLLKWAIFPLAKSGHTFISICFIFWQFISEGVLLILKFVVC
jgi:hypothetical protein